MCDYKVYLRPVPEGNGHIHRACLKKGEAIVSDESHGHVHHLEVKNGTVVQTQDDIATTGHIHPIVTILQPLNDKNGDMIPPNPPMEPGKNMAATNNNAVPTNNTAPANNTASTKAMQGTWWKWLVLALILFGPYRWWTQPKQEKLDVSKILNDLSEELSDA